MIKPAVRQILFNKKKLWTIAAIETNLWLDAFDSSTIISSSSAISQWSDKSGKARNLSQGIVGSQPLYSSTGLNGLPSIMFDGTNDFLKNNSYEIGVNGFACYLVAAIDVANGSIGSLFLSGTSTTEILILNGAAGYRNITITTANGGSSVGIDSATLSAPKILSVAHNGTGGIPSDYSIQENGTLIPAGLSGAVGYANETGFTIGLRSGQNTFPYKGALSEFILCSPSIDPLKITGRLAHKWNLTANLPSDHPYKNSPPYL